MHFCQEWKIQNSCNYRDGGAKGGGQDQDGAEDDEDVVEGDPGDGPVPAPPPGEAVRGAGDEDEALPRHAVRPWRRSLHESLPVR